MSIRWWWSHVVVILNDSIGWNSDEHPSESDSNDHSCDDKDFVTCTHTYWLRLWFSLWIWCWFFFCLQSCEWDGDDQYCEKDGSDQSCEWGVMKVITSVTG